MTLRLILHPHVKLNGDHTGKFDAYIGSDFVCRSREPLFDAARVLAARGYTGDSNGSFLVEAHKSNQ